MKRVLLFAVAAIWLACSFWAAATQTFTTAPAVAVMQTQYDSAYPDPQHNSLAYAFNAVLLAPGSWSNPYFAVYSAEPYLGVPGMTGDSTAGCYGTYLSFCSRPSLTARSTPASGPYFPHTQNDAVITRSMNGGYASSGAANPHLLTASNSTQNMGYGMFYLTVGGPKGPVGQDIGDGRHYMHVAAVDSNSFGNFYELSIGYQAPRVAERLL